MSYATSSLGYYGGTFFGGGTASSNGRTSNVYGSNVASSANLTRVSRDIAQGYSQDISMMKDYLEDGETTEALKLYEELFEDAKYTADEYGYNLNDSQVRSRINDAFKMHTGYNLSEAVSQNTHSSFVTGLIEGIPVLGWLFSDGISSADAKASLRGKSAPKAGEVAKEVAGATVTSALAIGGVFAGATMSTLGVGASMAIGAAGAMALPILGAGLAVGAAVVGIKHLISKA